jgi:hypothetical protein
MTLNGAEAAALIAHASARPMGRVIAEAVALPHAEAYRAGPRTALEARPIRCRLTVGGITDAHWRALRSLAAIQGRTVGDLVSWCTCRALGEIAEAYAKAGDPLDYPPGLEDVALRCEISARMAALAALAEAAP